MKTTVLLAAMAVATEARFEDVMNYETFDASSCITSANFLKTDAVYADSLSLKVPFRGEVLTLDVRANRDLFAEDWKLVDGEGEVITTDKEAFMCHYTGSVAGKKGSRVTISVCNEAGMNGLIETEEFDAEIQPVDATVGVKNLGSHIIYDMNDLVLPDDIEYGEAVEAFESRDFNFPNATDVGSKRAAYTMGLVTASDSARMGAFSSQSAEASDTQSVVAQMNNRYTATNWSGNSLRIQLSIQVANANMGGATNDLNNYLPRVASWKNSNYPTQDNVQAFTSWNSGGTIGLAYVRTMCDRQNSAGVNNVGFTSSQSSRGILVAHEAGHNFAMNHDDSTANNVMSSGINANAGSFSSRSVSEFLNSSPKTCL
jgi:hypothetical protein